MMNSCKYMQGVGVGECSVPHSKSEKKRSRIVTNLTIMQLTKWVKTDEFLRALHTQFVSSLPSANKKFKKKFKGFSCLLKK